MLGKYKRKKTFFLRAIIICSIISSGGCGSYCKVVEPNKSTGHFPTNTQVRKESIKINKQLDIKEHKALLYIRNTSSPPSGNLEFFNFMKKSIGKLEFFSEIKDKQQIRVEMAEDKVIKNTYQATDGMIIEWLQKKYKNFLIADYRLRSLGGYNFGLDFNVINPNNDETVLSISHKAFNLSGLDQPVFYPVLNSFSDWIRDNAS